MYSVRKVVGEELFRCIQFTSSSCANLLTRRELWPGFLAAEANVNGISIGAAIATALDAPEKARLCSVTVEKEHRRLGVASALLQAVEEQAGERGCSLMYANLIQKNSPPAVEISGLLKKNGWTEPASRGVICEMDLETILQAPWMKHDEVAADCEVLFWKDFSGSERQQLRDRIRLRPWFPETLSPFDHEERIVTGTSLGLRRKGEIAGWCIFHRVNSFATECASLVVAPELQGHGEAIALLTRGLRLHKNLPGHRKFVFDIGFDKGAMMRFLNRRVIPYLSSVRTIYRSTKLLNDRTAARRQIA
jgi:GNAT superfamily N-acetyltransferase